MNVPVSKPISKIKIADPRGGHNRYNCNFDFFKKWTNEMAYVLGFLYADGNITDAVSSRTQYIHFNNGDKEILEKIKVVLSSDHPLYIHPAKINIHKNGIYKSKELFVLRIGSRKMFQDLIMRGLILRKSKIINFPHIPCKNLANFIRGYFDGDGCVYFKKVKGIKKPIIIKKLSIIFTSGSYSFLEGLAKVLKTELGIDHDKIYNSKGAFQLRYSIKDSIKIFKFMYKICPYKLYLERKFNIFKSYFQTAFQKIDLEISRILNTLS